MKTHNRAATPSFRPVMFEAKGRGLFADIKAKVGDIAILDDVVFAFETLQALFCGGGKRAAGHKVFKTRYLGANKATLDIGVDLAGGLGRLRSFSHSPGAHLVLACCQEGNQVEQAIADLDDAI